MSLTVFTTCGEGATTLLFSTYRESQGCPARQTLCCPTRSGMQTSNCIQRRSSGYFSPVSSLRRELSPTRTLKFPRHNRVQITCNTLSAYHAQRVVCQLVRRDSSAIKFNRVEIVFYFSVTLLAKISDRTGLLVLLRSQLCLWGSPFWMRFFCVCDPF